MEVQRCARRIVENAVLFVSGYNLYTGEKTMRQYTIGILMIVGTLILVLCGSARAGDNNAQMREKPHAIGIYQPIDIFAIFGEHEFNPVAWENHIRHA